MYSKPPNKPPAQTFRTFEDLEAYQAARDFRKAGASLALHETSPAYGMTEDELNLILTESPVQRFNDSTIQRT